MPQDPPDQYSRTTGRVDSANIQRGFGQFAVHGLTNGIDRVFNSLSEQRAPGEPKNE